MNNSGFHTACIKRGLSFEIEADNLLKNIFDTTTLYKGRKLPKISYDILAVKKGREFKVEVKTTTASSIRLSDNQCEVDFLVLKDKDDAIKIFDIKKLSKKLLHYHKLIPSFKSININVYNEESISVNKLKEYIEQNYESP